jgi:hypothetical protein
MTFALARQVSIMVSRARLIALVDRRPSGFLDFGALRSG